MNNFRSMSNEYIIKRSQIGSVQSPTTGKTTNTTGTNNTVGNTQFNDVLQKIQSKSDVKFSKHALDRLNSRQISLSDNEISRINSAVEQANQKGVREALIMMDDKVFIASVKNKTIITAALEDQLKDNVFTNIDGAVII